MNLLRPKSLLALLAILFISSQPTSGMVTQPSTTRLVGALGLGLVEGYATAYLTAKTMSYLEPLSAKLDEALPGARYLVPCALALGSYELQMLAEKHERLSQISTGRPSTFWSHAKSFFSSATKLITLSTITQALTANISQMYHGVGSTTAIACNAHTPIPPAMCSFIADKTASTALTAASLAITTSAESLLPHDTHQLRVTKHSLTQLPCKATPTNECSALFKVPNIEGAQINYFLTAHNCDIEELWHRWLSQTKQVKESQHGDWQKFCKKQLLHMRKSITKAFNVTSKKLHTTTSTVIDLIHTQMPFGVYPQQFAINKEYVQHEQPSFSCTATNKPHAIFAGICQAVLSYFDPSNLQLRNQKGDEAIFNCPLTPVSINVNGQHVTITAYPQSRQDLLYPNQWEAFIKLPKWFAVASKVLPYGLILGQILYAKPSGYFLPEGATCFVQNGQMLCTNGESFSTTCSSHSSCLCDILAKRLLVEQTALKIFGLDPQSSHTPKEIKERYRKLVLRYHPDKCQPIGECTKKFELIQKAYETLKTNGRLS